MSANHHVESSDLSIAWAKAVRPMLAKGGVKEIAPLVVSTTGFENGVVRETTAIRDALDQALLAIGLQSCDTVANTIFPESLWNPAAPRAQLFDRYSNLLPQLKRASSKNTRGLYFERMITGGSAKNPNQLDFVIKTYTARRAARRGALQVAIFDPARDHTGAALAGFPCLQHVTFAPTASGLSVNAFYATQYAIERAYGNYLGICRLGRFVAHELGMPLVRMTCFTGISLRDANGGDRRSLLSAIDATLGKDSV